MKTDDSIQMSEEMIAQGTFTSLEEYFAHIGYLATLHSNNILASGDNADNGDYQRYSKFLMLPADEIDNDNACFKINANQRSITVPSSFAKYGVSVTGDQMAETLMFKIDRYFDYTDLATTEIYIQWTNPAGQEGASRITLVDYESIPGQIIFGWPLTDKVTVEGNGLLKFAVRFFIRDSQTKKIKYSLNILPATVSIKQALYTDFNNDIPIDDPTELFKEAIINGPVTDGIEPLVPDFLADWMLKEKEYLGDDDTVILQTQGTSEDSGIISYNWYYTPRFIEDNVVVEKPIEGPYTIVPKTYTYVLTADEAREGNKVYYTLNDGVYSPHEGELVAGVEYYEGVASYVIPKRYTYVLTTDEVREDNKVYYTLSNEVYSPYEGELIAGVDYYESKEVEKDSITTANKNHWPHVTGKYSVTIINRVGSNTKEKKSDKVCEIPCIEKLDFTQNLPLGKTLEVLDEGHFASLGVIVEANDVNAEKTYQWYYANLEHGREAVADATSATLGVSEPGWYDVVVTGELNREVMTANSAVCKVTKPVEAPKTPEHYINDEFQVSDGTIEKDVENNTNVKLRVEVATMNKLESDGFSYTWYRNTPDQNGTVVSSDDADIVAMNNNEITVQLFPSESGVAIAHYYCEITNTLAGVSKSIVSDVFQLR